MEHSTVDGATLVTAIRRMHDVSVPASVSASPEPVAPPEELTWKWSDEDIPILEESLSDVSRDVTDIATHIVTVPLHLPINFPSELVPTRRNNSF